MSHKVRHGLGTREIVVVVRDDLGYDLVFDTSVWYDTVDEVTVAVTVPGRHQVVITDGEKVHAEWLEF